MTTLKNTMSATSHAAGLDQDDADIAREHATEAGKSPVMLNVGISILISPLL